MKKIVIILSAAVLALVACNKSMDVNTSEAPIANEMSFKVMSAAATKAGELTGISMPKTYGIYAAATQKSAAGLIENASYFASPYEQLFGTTEADPSGINTASAAADSRQWHAGSYGGDPTPAFTPAAIYWPMGNVKMDFLAYAIPMASHQNTGLSTGVWSATWDNPTTDVASQFTFNDVDTYANQIDVLYAAANNQTNLANGGASHSTVMAFKHAQALLIFNVKVNDEIDGKLTIDDIEFITDARLAELQEHEQLLPSNPSHVLPTLADNQVTLLTKGDFIVNNQRNDLIAKWDGLSSAKENYRMPVSAASLSASNNVVQGQTSKTVQAYEAAIDYVTGDEYAQLGETLLIPEQEKVNFVIKYEMGGCTMFYKYNDLRGVWEKGKKYIYNLDINLNEIVITESVADFVDAALADVVLN